jgi:hypothetical protein
MLAVVLVVGLALGGIGVGVGLSTNPVAVAQQPEVKQDDGKTGGDKADWRIGVLDEQIATLRQQQKRAEQEAARLNKQSAALERTIGELLAQRERFLKKPDGKEEPPAIKKDQKKGEETQPMPQQEPVPKNAKQEQKVLTPEEAIKQRAKEKVTVQFKVTAVEAILTSGAIAEGSKVSRLWVRLKDGEKFSVQLRGRVTYQIERLGIDPAKHFNDKTIRVTGQVQHIESAGTFQIVVDDLDQIEVVSR